MQTLQIFLAVTWALLVPGLPIAFWLVRKRGFTALAFAVTPLLSVVCNWALIFSLNLVGIRPNLAWLAALLLVATAVATPFAARGFVTWRTLRTLAWQVAAVVAIAAAIWAYAYRGFLFFAPNEDAFWHNLWIRRIADSGSVLWSDFFTRSPLTPVGHGIPDLTAVLTSAGYPPGWHATMGPAIALTGASVPQATLTVTVAFWCIALTFGLFALARVWAPSRRHLGFIAACTAQAMPLVPGLPVSWGAMPSIVGIALLPGAFACALLAVRGGDWRLRVAAVAAALGIALVHTPEAATLLVVGGACLVVDGLQRRAWVFAVAAAVVVSALYGAWFYGLQVAKPDLYRLLAEQKGRYELREGIDLFVSMSVHTPHVDRLLPAFLIGGVALAILMRERLFLPVGVLVAGLIFLASAAPTPFFAQFRELTFPWYASYERTAWVAVPFVALLAAYPAALVLSERKRVRASYRPLIMAIGLVLAVAVVVRGVPYTIDNLRVGPEANQTPGPGAQAVFDAARKLRAGDGMFLSYPGEGGIYAYAFAGVPVSNGALGRDGTGEEPLARLLADPALVCSDPAVQEALERNRIRGIIIGDEATAWGGAIRTPQSVAAIRGWRILQSGGGLFLIVPDPKRC